MLYAWLLCTSPSSHRLLGSHQQQGAQTGLGPFQNTSYFSQRFISQVVVLGGRGILPLAGIQLEIHWVVLHKADSRHPWLAQFSHLA